MSIKLYFNCLCALLGSTWYTAYINKHFDDKKIKKKKEMTSKALKEVSSFKKFCITTLIVLWLCIVCTGGNMLILTPSALLPIKD